ncbi:MAG: ABC transporter substrate-binding protein [Porticoccus sp.]|nr:ABC transporter substrate-binding protein [Porticoccus sp.]MBQ0807561.1 ABC transporter substrate-binding protein [Porticoccus sp.]
MKATMTSIHHHNTVLAIILMASFLFTVPLASAGAVESLTIPILYLHQTIDRPPVLSNIHVPPKDSGIKGAELAIHDSNTTGRFLNHHYQLQYISANDLKTAQQQTKQWLQQGHQLILAHLPAKTLVSLANTPGIQGKAILINIAAKDDELRTQHCTTGLLHVIPSRAMLADALAQFLVVKRWRKWLLIRGGMPEDKAFAKAIKRSAKRFGGKLLEEKHWRFDTDLRRTAQQELPLFTQTDDYDITLVADEAGDVGEYIPYNTWRPRPVAGTQGLTPLGWHAVVEQWGAIQLQNRFRSHAQRPMNDIDYAAWVAVRAIAEAVTRTGDQDASTLYSYLFSEHYELAAFKGRKLSFRPWNGQLRQPIPLVHPRALVSQSPQPGFLHPHSELDTLGFDKAEVSCHYRLTL